MRIVQASSQEVLSKHNHILSRGLMVDLPSIQQVLDGEISVIKHNTKQTFLTDFIDSKSDTPGNRLARYALYNMTRVNVQYNNSQLLTCNYQLVAT